MSTLENCRFSTGNDLSLSNLVVDQIGVYRCRLVANKLISDSLVVIGTTLLNGATIFGGTVLFEQNVVFEENVSVDGALIVNNLNVTGFNVHTNLTVMDTTDLNILNVSGPATFCDDTVFKGDVLVTGANLNVTGGTLSVDGVCVNPSEDYVTFSTPSVCLPNARELVAGEGIVLDVSTPGVLTAARSRPYIAAIHRYDGGGGEFYTLTIIPTLLFNNSYSLTVTIPPVVPATIFITATFTYTQATWDGVGSRPTSLIRLLRDGVPVTGTDMCIFATTSDQTGIVHAQVPCIVSLVDLTPTPGATHFYRVEVWMSNINFSIPGVIHADGNHMEGVITGIIANQP